jgi:hypothetical protein
MSSSDKYIYGLLLIIVLVGALSYIVRYLFKEHFAEAKKFCINNECIPDVSLKAIQSLNGLTEGQSIKCLGSKSYQQRVHRYEGGLKRHYPNPTVAASWDKEWSKAKTYNCALLPDGDHMTLKAPAQPAKK